MNRASHTHETCFYGNVTLAAYLTSPHLASSRQSRWWTLLHARSITDVKRSDHIAYCLFFSYSSSNSSWLYSLLAYRRLHIVAIPNCLQGVISAIPSRCLLTSSSRNQLVINPTHLSYVGDRAFSSAAPRLWNMLVVTERCHPAPSFQSFRCGLNSCSRSRFLITPLYCHSEKHAYCLWL